MIDVGNSKLLNYNLTNLNLERFAYIFFGVISTDVMNKHDGMCSECCLPKCPLAQVNVTFFRVSL